MQPITEPLARKRGLVDRMAIVLLVGVVAVSVGGVTLLTIYLDRIGDTAAVLAKVDPLPSYEGRPAPVAIDGVEAVNYLLMTTADDTTLESVLIAHLSASRRNLTLIALPPDLMAPDGTGSLATSYRADPLRTARALEALTGSRMDHQVHLDASRFTSVVDSIGGLEVPGGRLSGAQVVGYLSGDPQGRSERTATLLRAALERASMGSALTDPGTFDKVLNAIVPCVTVDAGLTADVIRDTMMESRVQAGEIVTWPLATMRTTEGTFADPTALEELRTALTSDTFPAANTTAGQANLPTPQPTR
ncbi:MAG TPA: LCP family protein [Propionicimonas sp.]|jgi:hypothetical protein|uniref:LCP family glycopolymer transferase n=1 Tax=Propionicimonas sp. TaxID=1955623 RepID=UPI002F4262D6